MGHDRPRVAPGALVAFAIGLALFGADVSGLLPWPRVATRSLAALFVLAALTRAAGDLGVLAQRRLRYAVAGVALCAAAWFAGGAMLASDRTLLALALGHVAAAWLTAAPEQDPVERERGRIILAAAMSAVSLVAMAALPSGARIPGAPVAPLALAIAVTAGAFFTARGRAVGVALTGVASVIALVLAARLTSEIAAQGSAWQVQAGRAAPMIASTTVLGALPSIVTLGLRLPEWSRALAPPSAPLLRRALTWLALPVVFAVAIAVLAP